MFSLKVTVEEDEKRIFELKVSCESMKNLGKIIETVMQSLREVGLGSSECSDQLRREDKIAHERGSSTHYDLHEYVTTPVGLVSEDVMRLNELHKYVGRPVGLSSEDEIRPDDLREYVAVGLSSEDEIRPDDLRDYVVVGLSSEDEIRPDDLHEYVGETGRFIERGCDPT